MANGDPTILYGFNATSPSAVRNAQRYAARRVTEVSKETIAAIRALTVRGFRENIPPRELARIIAGRAPGTKALVGMHSIQAQAALNYRDALEAAGLASSTVNREMAKYVRRKVAERALNIARTETMTSLNHGRNAQFNTARRKGLIAKDAEKEWIITPDERLCALCAPMAGVTVRVDKEFETARGSVKAPPLHPSCRCTVVLRPIPGGKRLSPIPQPGAPPVFPIPIPKAPPAPPAPAPSAKAKPAPSSPSTAPTLTPAPSPTPAGGDPVILNTKTIGYTKIGEERAAQILADMAEITVEQGKKFPRARGVVVQNLEVYDHNIKLSAGKWAEDGTFGLHAWDHHGLRTRRIALKADGAQHVKADKLHEKLGTGRNILAGESIPNAYRHEFGHAVWYQSLTNAERSRARGIYNALLSKPAPAGASTFAKSELSRVSLYAETKASEMWAEAYQVYTHPSYVPEMLGGELRPLRQLLDDILTTPPPANTKPGAALAKAALEGGG
jgi:hypothetical protein